MRPHPSYALTERISTGSLQAMSWWCNTDRFSGALHAGIYQTLFFTCPLLCLQSIQVARFQFINSFRCQALLPFTCTRMLHHVLDFTHVISYLSLPIWLSTVEVSYFLLFLKKKKMITKYSCPKFTTRFAYRCHHPHPTLKNSSYL